MRGIFLFIIVLRLGMSLVHALDPRFQEAIIRDVTVPTNRITVDSLPEGGYRYSGELTYNLESSLDSIQLHVYLETVPFARYFVKEQWEGGQGALMRIDSLCTGDLGWVRPKSGNLIHWTFTTPDKSLHARIKVGMANLDYVLRERRDYASADTMNPIVTRFGYDNRGLDKSMTYNLHGQVLFDPPYRWRRYDAGNRLVYEQLGMNATLQFIFGWVYDSLSRAVEKDHLPPGFAPESPGKPFNRELYQFDAASRMTRSQKYLSATQFACNRDYRFYGLDIQEYFYRDAAFPLPDSTVRSYLDTAKQNKLLLREHQSFRYNPDSTVDSYDHWTEGFDVPGTCWSPEYDMEDRGKIQYDAHRHPFKTLLEIRTSPSGAFKTDSSCNVQDYDERGNPIRSYLGCTDKVDWEAAYNIFNHKMEEKHYLDGAVNSRTRYQWELIDLDQQEEFKHD
jgi:hypothetical protein